MKKSHRIAILLMLLLVIPVSAQDSSEWWVFLFDQQNQQLVRVNNLGESEEYGLGLADNTFIGGHDLTFTEDGTIAAYCIQNMPPDSQTAALTVHVRDLAAETDTLTLDVGEGVACRVSAFNEDETLLAVGLARYYPGNPGADTTQPAWALLLIDLTTGETVQELNGDMVTLPPVGNFPLDSFLPEVKILTDEQAIFQAIYFGGELITVPAFVWDRETGTVEPETSGMWENFGGDFLETTGEVAWMWLDPDRPIGQPGALGPLYNVALVNETEIYSDPEWIVLDAKFVNNGQELAIYLLEPYNFDSATPQPQDNQLIAVSRDSDIRELGTYPSFVQFRGAPDGLVVLWADAPGDVPPTLHLDYHRSDVVTELWSKQSGHMGISWQLVWVSPGKIPGDMQSFR